MENLPESNDETTIVGYGTRPRLLRELSFHRFDDRPPRPEMSWFETLRVLNNKELTGVYSMYGTVNFVYRISMCDTEKIVYENRFGRLIPALKRYVLEFEDEIIRGESFFADDILPLSRCNCGLFKIDIQVGIGYNPFIYSVPHHRIGEYHKPITLVTETYKITANLEPFKLKHISAAMVLKNLASYTNADIYRLQYMVPVACGLNNLLFRHNRSKLDGWCSRDELSWKYMLLKSNYIDFDYNIYPYCPCIVFQHKVNLCTNNTVEYLLDRVFGELNGHLTDCYFKIKVKNTHFQAP